VEEILGLIVEMQFGSIFNVFKIIVLCLQKDFPFWMLKLKEDSLMMIFHRIIFFVSFFKKKLFKKKKI